MTFIQKTTTLQKHATQPIGLSVTYDTLYLFILCLIFLKHSLILPILIQVPSSVKADHYKHNHDEIYLYCNPLIQ